MDRECQHDDDGAYQRTATQDEPQHGADESSGAPEITLLAKIGNFLRDRVAGPDLGGGQVPQQDVEETPDPDVRGAEEALGDEADGKGSDLPDIRRTHVL